MNYYPLPGIEKIQELSYSFSEFQVILVDHIIEYITNSSNNVQYDKNTLDGVLFYVIQYFVDKFTRPDSENIIVYTYTDEGKIIYSFVNNRYQLADAFFNYILTNVTRKGIFTEYWCKIDLFSSFIEDRFDGTVDSKEDLEKLFKAEVPVITPKEEPKVQVVSEEPKVFDPNKPTDSSFVPEQGETIEQEPKPDDGIVHRNPKINPEEIHKLSKKERKKLKHEEMERARLRHQQEVEQKQQQQQTPNADKPAQPKLTDDITKLPLIETEKAFQPSSLPPSKPQAPQPAALRPSPPPMPTYKEAFKQNIPPSSSSHSSNDSNCRI